MSPVALTFAIISLIVALSLVALQKLAERKVRIMHFTSAQKLDERVRLRAIEIVEKWTRMPAYLCNDEEWHYAVEQAEVEIWDMVVPEEERRESTTKRPTKEESFDPWDKVRPRSLATCYFGAEIKEAKKIILRKEFPEGSFFCKHLGDAFELGGPVIFEVICPRKWWENTYDLVNGKLTAAKKTEEGHDKWQHIIDEPMKTNCVVSIKEYSVNVILERNDLARKVFENNC